MIENMIKAVIPGALAKLAAIPLADKQLFARYLSVMLEEYADGNKSTVESMIDKFSAPPDLKSKILAAVWSDANKSK